jgi:glycosyltransferase involved in cell wall biosynthesis
MRTGTRSVRIYPELRAAQVQRDSQLTPAEGWFFNRNYDLPADEVSGHFVAVTTLSALRSVARGNVGVLEVPELLWARELPRTVALLLAHKVCTRGSSRRVFYAIENNEPRRALFGTRAFPKPAVALALTIVGGTARLLIDAIAFGSQGAQRSYESLPFLSRVRSALVEELPAQPPTQVPGSSGRRGAIFVGALEARKGITQLRAAWEQVEQTLPEAVLTIVGDGPLSDDVLTWSRANPDRRKLVGRLPHARVAELLLESAVLVAPSQRDGRWREQISLPIKEALAAGVTVVSTSDTGLSSWLADHGHFIADGTDHALPDAIEIALTQPLDPKAVVAALPTEDGRVVADRWLHDGQGDPR